MPRQGRGTPPFLIVATHVVGLWDGGSTWLVVWRARLRAVVGVVITIVVCGPLRFPVRSWRACPRSPRRRLRPWTRDTAISSTTEFFFRGGTPTHPMA